MPKESKTRLAQRCNRIFTVLKKVYPQAHCALDHRNPLELLVATILSAQCTDKRVNIVTEHLFKKYRTAGDFAAATQEQLQQDIRTTGFFRNKAKNIRAAAAIITEQFHDQIPDTMEELLTLPGVARKTANVVLDSAFGKNEGVVVDTHVRRLSQRLALTSEQNPEKIERDLMQLVPRPKWGMFSHLLIFHGRSVCKARNPDCASCPLADKKLCPSAKKG